MIKIFPTQSIKQLDAYTIEHEPVASIDLMERAAHRLATAIASRWDAATPFVVFAGPGNNGGDALAVARLLALKGYRLAVYLFNPKDELSPDCQTNRDRLQEVSGVDFHEVSTQFVPPALTARHVVVDGLFGSGLNKPLSGGFAAVVNYVNASPARVVAIDIPSGLMGEDNSYNVMANVIHADLTLSLQLPKLAFFFAENAPYVGEWQVVDIGLHPGGIERTATDFFLLEEDDVRPLLRRRGRFEHKGNFGRALLIAGSRGMAGASVLAARACLRSGVGLLTVHVPVCNNLVLQTAVPEAKTEVDFCEGTFAEAPDTDDYQAVACGPGLGMAEETEKAVLELVNSCQTPLVLDADALNILGAHRNYLRRLPKNAILTPHPTELERMVGKCQNSYDRLMKARELAENASVYIILKGAYTAIVTPEGHIFFNPTGNPGMATGGSGDVLTGLLLALLAQGYEPQKAAWLGVYVHGQAGDEAAARLGQMALTASDIVDALPGAWQAMERTSTVSGGQ